MTRNLKKTFCLRSPKEVDTRVFVMVLLAKKIFRHIAVYMVIGLFSEIIGRETPKLCSSLFKNILL